MDKEESATAIQRWWRRKLEADRRLAEKAKNLAESRYLSRISLQNDALLEKLAKLRREKNYEVMKYERVLNMPARDVNGFLRSEAEKKSELMDERELVLERALDRQRHEAARVIQRTFRRFYSQRLAEKYLRSITVIKPGRRIALLEKINNRLGMKQYVRTVPLEEIKQALSDHRSSQSKEAANFARRQQLIQDVNRISMAFSMASLSHPSSLRLLKGSRPISEFKAKRHHEEEILLLEEDEWA